MAYRIVIGALIVAFGAYCAPDGATAMALGFMFGCGVLTATWGR